MRKIITLSVAICLTTLSFGQIPTLTWAKSAGGIEGENFVSSSVDDSGNMYSCGTFSSPTFQVGTTTLTNAGTASTYDIYIVKYDPSGNVLWAKSAGGTGSDYVEDIAVDKNGSIFITGCFTGTSINFGTITLNNTSVGQRDAYLTKYDSDGNVLFSNLYGGTQREQNYKLQVDVNNYIYFICAYNSPSLTIGTFNLTNESSSLADDLLIVKCDSLGNVIWAESFGGTGYDKGFGVTSDLEGNLYVSGTFDSPTINFGNTIILKQ